MTVYLLLVYLASADPIVFEFKDRDACSTAKLAVMSILENGKARCAEVVSEISRGPIAQKN